MGAVALDVGLLRRRRDFGLLVAGQFVSNAGSFLTVVALPFQVYALTHSSLAVGLLGLAEFVPIVGLGLLGGALADAVDRRRDGAGRRAGGRRSSRSCSSPTRCSTRPICGCSTSPRR